MADFYKKFSFSILLIKKSIIINFSLYSLMSLNQKTMEYGHVCHLILLSDHFFFNSAAYAGKFTDQNKMESIRKKFIQENILFKVDYFNTVK